MSKTKQAPKVPEASIPKPEDIKVDFRRRPTSEGNS